MDANREGALYVSDYSIGKGSRGATSSYSSRSFRGRLMHAHPNDHNVWNYYEVLMRLEKKGSTSTVFIAQRRRHPTSKLSQWIRGLWHFSPEIAVTTNAVDTRKNPLNMNCKCKDEQQLYAIKAIRKDRVKNPYYLKELQNEIRLLKHLDHKNIVRIYESFEQNSQIHLVIECCEGGDLYERAPYVEQSAAKIVRQILSAVNYLHKNRVIHRDLKFENILFDSEHPDAEIKLIDFGLSRHFSRGQDQRTGKGGTVYAMAPEVLNGTYDPKADIWSIGVIAYMLLSSKKPFEGETREEIARKISCGDYSFSSNVWDAVSTDAKEFVSSLLNMDPKKRPTASQALTFSWVNFKKLSCSSSSSSNNNKKLDPKIIMQVKHNLEIFSAAVTIKKLGFIYIAHRSSKEQVLHLRQLFCDFDDESQDGMMTFEDFKKTLAHTNYSDAEIRRIFNSADMNNSGVIDYTVFIAASLEMQGRINKTSLREAFHWLDVDKSGSITQKDLQFLLGGKFSEAFITKCIEEVDRSSKKGKISFKDFLQLFDEDESIKSVDSY
eukprot:CAMPEP_0172415214 /NCGR_PEP_ID=MMETSP1064-20121228/1683_1 /TAXON_ID=202472 /ORGANISM="Aulacoseira subarctica , Strain CCAP 1002/5" /LENGTH=548 /DNA_ID=CAMNT_0013152127 /DNA_START=66 /DNA_END=1712 /DNA_ORIENTATION=+